MSDLFLRPPRPESLLLAAIHKWSVGRPLRLVRMLPAFARPGDPILLEGSGLEGGELRARFGRLATWALALSDAEALTVVPEGAMAGPLALLRYGARSNSLAYGGPPREGASAVVRVDPRDGAVGVFRNPVVLVHLSRPLDPASLSPTTFRVDDGQGPVAGHLRCSPDRRILVWMPSRPLAPGLEHRLAVDGLLDQDGGRVARHRSRFTPCDLLRPRPGS